MKITTEKNRNEARRVRDLRRVLVFFGLLGGFVFYISFVYSNVAARGAAENELDELFAVEVESGQTDFSRFRHSNQMHARLPCLLCHKRDDNSATPRFSGHIPCASCHAQQFADNQNQICTICHTNPAAGALKRFPPLRSFNAKFDHAKHLRQTGCATCHKPQRGGIGFTEPDGLNAHVTCYQCHTPRAEIGGRNIGSCGVCHEPGRPPANPPAARSYRVNFRHSAHLRSMSCATCHTVRAGAARGRQVSAPLASMHFASSRSASCATCHNNRRVFGGEDFSDCKRCHTGGTFRFR